MVRLLGPWTRPGRLGVAAAHVASGLVAGIVTFTVAVTLAAVTVGTLPAVFFGIPLAWLTAMVVRGMARLERVRAAAFGPPIGDPVPPLTGASWWRRLVERARCRARWRELLHAVVLLPVGVIGYTIVAALWGGSAALLLLPAYVGSFPGDSAKFHVFEIGAGTGTAWLAAATGLVGLLLVAPWATIAASAVQWSTASRLLGPTGDERLARQVERLETSRTAAVDSAEQERRRIERDLHDGAQQRLVALAATLGAARDKLDGDPAGGRELVASAHEEAKAALGEIRDLVRGIHPVILEDRGIDAALSAVVARSPVPVELDVRILERPSAATESAAYFVVSEALTNVARHSAATKSYVTVVRASDRLVVEIRDNGRGGADLTKGSGLRGLHDRVAGLGGSMYVISPEGGPTTISVELPCAS